MRYLIDARAWMKLNDIMLNEVRQILYDSTYMRYSEGSKSESQKI